MIELIDELNAGAYFVGSAAIGASFELSHQGLVAVLYLAPAALALVLEPVIFLLADRWPRRAFVAGGLATMALASLACALAPTPVALAAAITVGALAGSCGVELAQATLADLHPDGREQVLARWTLFGAVGDLAAPLLVAVLAGVGLGWRTGFAVMAAVLAAWAVLVARAPFPAPTRPAAPDAPDAEDGEAEPGILDALRAALRERRLLGWLAATALCDLLDELLVLLAAVHLRDQLGAGPVARSLVLAGHVLAAIAALAVLERLLERHRPERLLAAAAVACAAALVAWLATPWLWLSAILFAVVGATAAPLYPLAMAQSYAALPGRSGAVHAAARVFTPGSLVLPWLLAWLADHVGTQAALAVIAAGPASIAILAVALTARGGASSPRV